MKIIDHKDAINRRLYNNQFFVETAIYRVSCLNRTVLRVFQKINDLKPVITSETFAVASRREV